MRPRRDKKKPWDNPVDLLAIEEPEIHEDNEKVSPTSGTYLCRMRLTSPAAVDGSGSGTGVSTATSPSPLYIRSSPVLRRPLLSLSSLGLRLLDLMGCLTPCRCLCFDRRKRKQGASAFRLTRRRTAGGGQSTPRPPTTTPDRMSSVLYEGSPLDEYLRGKLHSSATLARARADLIHVVQSPRSRKRANRRERSLLSSLRRPKRQERTGARHPSRRRARDHGRRSV